MRNWNSFHGCLALAETRGASANDSARGSNRRAPRASLILSGSLTAEQFAITGWLAYRFKRIAGGLTGDFLGATPQLSELAFLLVARFSKRRVLWTQPLRGQSRCYPHYVGPMVLQPLLGVAPKPKIASRFSSASHLKRFGVLANSAHLTLLANARRQNPFGASRSFQIDEGLRIRYQPCVKRNGSPASPSFGRKSA